MAWAASYFKKITLAAQCRLNWRGTSVGQGDQIGGRSSGLGRAGDGVH